MKAAHEGKSKQTFPVPENIVFVNIDNETGYLASAESGNIVQQAFEVGTEPIETKSSAQQDDEAQFYKEDLSE